MSAARGPDALARAIKSAARALGFDGVGIASPEPGPDTAFFSEWIDRGYAGEMAYLERRREERQDPSRVLPGIRSVVALALLHDPAADAPDPRVASYAGGEDYHDVLLDRVRAVATAIEALARRSVATRCYVDTGPVQERAFAARAGLGWIGKNTCLIHPRLGSRMMLGVVLCDLALAFDAPEPDHCGTCTACLDACPTDAFPEPGVLDARRCISYTTIEIRGAIPEALRAAQGERVFGCDVCQDVCPWNRARGDGERPDPLGLRARLRRDPRFERVDLGWLLELDRDAFLDVTRHTALRRARHRGLLRNALVAAGNARDPRLRVHLERHAAGADALLAEHARWALARLDAAEAPPERAPT